MRWYLRFRPSCADAVERLAERFITAAAAAVLDGARECAPLYQEAAQVYRHRAGRRWSAHETHVKAAGRRGYVRRAVDEYGQVVEVLFQERRDSAAAAFFRSALENTGVTPRTVSTDQAAACPPARAPVFPEVGPITGKAEPPRIERDHRHLKGRLKVFRGCKTVSGAPRFCRAHGFGRTLRHGFYRLGAVAPEADAAVRPPWIRARESLANQSPTP